MSAKPASREKESGVPVAWRGLVEVRVGEGLGVGRVEGGRLIEVELGLRGPPQAGHRSGSTSVDSTLASAVKRAKIEKRVTPHTFRHTYAATRLQTIDHGQPVSSYTVMRELGHSSLSLIEKMYRHLLEIRVRSAVVEYREAKVVPFRQRVEGR